MKKIFLIIAILFSIQSFAQDDDFFWSYNHHQLYDTIKVNRYYFTGGLFTGLFSTYSGDSLQFITPRGTTKIPSGVFASTTGLEGLLLGYEEGFLISKRNDLWRYEPTNVSTVETSQARLLKEVYLSRLNLIDGSLFIDNKVLEKIAIQETQLNPYPTDFSGNGLLNSIYIVGTLVSSITLPASGVTMASVIAANNPLLTTMNFGPLNPNIYNFYGYNNVFNQENVDKILKYFVDSNRNPINLGTTATDVIDLCGAGNAIPSALGMGYVGTLLSRGWNVCINSNVVLPTVQTNAVTMISQTTATGNGSVVHSGNAPVTARGTCWSTSLNPTVFGSKTIDGSDVGNFSSSITGLTAGTTYHVRAYAANSAGTGYGEDLTFTTLPPTQTVPVLITSAVTGVTSTAAVSGGHITSDGAYPIYQKGVCWSTSPNPNTFNSKTEEGTGTADFVSSITVLSPGATYYLRAYATNRRYTGSFYVYATGYGQEEVFTTPTEGGLATIAYAGNTGLTSSSITIYGNVASDGGLDVTIRGVCWGTSPNPTVSDSKTMDGSGGGFFSSYISGLNPNTLYYTRLYAENEAGIAYTSNFAFTTLCDLPSVLMSSVSDIKATSAIAYGNVTGEGSCAISERGLVYSSTNTNPTVGGSGVTKNIISGTTGSFGMGLNNLTCGTTYYVNAYAINGAGTSYGTTVSFTTTSLTLATYDFWNSITSSCGSHTVTNEATAKQAYLDYINAGCTSKSKSGIYGDLESLILGGKLYTTGVNCEIQTSFGWYFMTEGYIIQFLNGEIITKIQYPW